ncbi:MAG: hypothetical protein ACOX4R_06015 [Lentihominibacter sp.]|jgi:hypothetical protein
MLKEDIMIKFEYMINLPGHTPGTYFGEYVTEESIARIVGIDYMDMAVEHTVRLAKERMHDTELYRWF